MHGVCTSALLVLCMPLFSAPLVRIPLTEVPRRRAPPRLIHFHTSESFQVPVRTTQPPTTAAPRSLYRVIKYNRMYEDFRTRNGRHTLSNGHVSRPRPPAAQVQCDWCDSAVTRRLPKISNK
ncbi:hypothetical protein B5X24_HaOG211491 [Helicoverpa armigera]|nr:hypothetical protein B5X24_HaOG211491 [Helicoverpa armigera]